MLDRDHPRYPHILRASKLLGDLGGALKNLVKVPPLDRQAHLSRCLLQLDQLRALGAEHFPDRPEIAKGLNDYASALQAVSGTDESTDQGHLCEDLPRKSGTAFLTRCVTCDEALMTLHLKLESGSGFGTAFI